MPIPPSHEAAFLRLVGAARRMFGAHQVTVTLLAPDDLRLPLLEVPGLSFIGEQWIVAEFAGGRRWELDWDERGIGRALSLLERRRRRMRLDDSARSGLLAWIESLVGAHGRATVASPPAEFDLEMWVNPDRNSALPFCVHARHGGTVVVESDQLGRWTFGGDLEDGESAAKDMIEQIVLYGGSVRRTWRGITLLDEHGDYVMGPTAGTRLSIRPQLIPFRAYC